MKAILTFLFSLSIVLTASFAVKADSMRGPESFGKGKTFKEPVLETSVPRIASRGLLSFWHNVLTRADGPRSPMYPTASGYMDDAVKKHGMVLGIIMTADRLMHEGDEQRRVPRIIKYGVSRAYDPVESNDFWWTQSPKKGGDR
ncbi:MAG: membrane protein insertion efficiency factor YidD [Candidatus Tectomicrobia bacterium]|nr:membrane protein insertion efficiency factor YidD [Candidatus Tectomicrobia bacterium]